MCVCVCVSIGKVPGIYTTWSPANTQIEGYSGACHPGFDDITNCVEFMIAKGDFSEVTIKVYGHCGGQHTLPNWQSKISDPENYDRSDISHCGGSVHIGLVFEIPPLSSMPPSCHTEVTRLLSKVMILCPLQIHLPLLTISSEI